MSDFLNCPVCDGMSAVADNIGCDRCLNTGHVEPEQREWVVGFLFNTDASRVVLIRKTHPRWQSGKLNGVGGGVEVDEYPIDAMRREFHEEADVAIPDWQHFASLTWEQGIVLFYRSFHSDEVVNSCRTLTDEVVERHVVHMLGRRDDIIPNLRWMVPLAAHRHDDYAVLSVVETGTTLRKVGRLP